MKNLNKVLAMLVVFMMVVSTVAFAAFTDVAEDSTYNVAVKVGTDLGLFTGYEDGSFKPEGEITRAEFAAIVVRMKGQEAQAEGAKSATMFTDVPADHWAAGYINIAVRLGIINGYGDGNFGPSDLVEYQDAITMIVRALGYEPAIGAAGYPTGYLTKAGDLGLTANVSGVNGVAINRGKVAQIVFNALDVPLMTQSGYGTFTQYVVNDGFSATNGQDNIKKTILSENHNIVKVMGIVKSSSIVTNASTTGVEKVDFDVTNALYNKFKIDDRNMEVGTSDAAAYVGKKVIAFVHYNEFENIATIASIYEAPVSDSLVVALQDLDSYDESLVGDYAYVNENGRTVTVSVAKKANVYINGVNLSLVNNTKLYTDDLFSMSGTIEFALLDATNTTDDYDTVYIDAATAFVVDTVKTGTSTVKPKVSKVAAIRYIDEAKYEAALYAADGSEMDFADLEENDVLMVKYIKTADKEIVSAKVVDNVIEGKIDGLASDPGDFTREATIGGVAYSVVDGAEDHRTMKSGDEGVFYLDENNNIVYYDVTSTVSRNYGYVIAVAEPKDGDFLSGYQMQILTKENEIVVYDLYKKIKYNDVTGVEVDKDTASSTPANDNPDTDKIDETNKVLGSKEFKALPKNVITYNVNSANEITAIYTAAAMSTVDDEDLDSSFTYDDSKSFKGELTGFDPDDNSFDGGYSIDENTVIFLKGYDLKGTEALKDSEVVAVPALEEDDKFVGATLYNVDEDGYISCIFIDDAKKASVIGGQAENATFVLKISTTTDDDGNDVYVVAGYKGLEPVEYVVEDASKLTGLVGNLVVPVYAVNGKVVDFHKAPATFAEGEKTITEYTVKEFDRNKVIMTNGTELKIRTNTNVYVFDDIKFKDKGRGHYQIDADGYLDYDDETYGLYYGTNNGEYNLKVKAVVFDIDGDVTDILYIIYK